MQAVIGAFAEVLRGHDLPAAHAAAGLLDTLRDSRARPPAEKPLPPHLAEALALPGAHALAQAFAPEAGRVDWIRITGKAMPAGFAERYLFCDIAGPGCRFASDRLCFGAYLQFPNTWYPRHWHAAEELYFILAGTARWSRDGVEGAPAPPGTLIRHAAHERHATRTGAEPVLAFWVWMGDLTIGSYEIDDI